MTAHSTSAITRSREPYSSLCLYHMLKWSVVNPLFLTYFQGNIYGAENVPSKGPLLVVSNHASNLDPPLLSNCVQRPVAYMAKEELFRVPIFKQAIELYGAYPVKRGAGDRSAIKSALRRLERGWAVGVFLQGTRTKDARVPNPKMGAALIAAKAQVPLLPVSLWGTQAIFVKGKQAPQSVPVTVRIGIPISPPSSSDRDALKAITQACADAIHSLHDLGR